MFKNYLPDSIADNGNTANHFLLSSQANNNRLYQQRTDRITVYDGTTFQSVSGFDFSQPSNIAFVFNGSITSIYQNGILKGQINTLNFPDFNRIGNSFGITGFSLQELYVYDVAVTDVNNITEVPVYTLKSDLVDIPSGYGPMYKWYAKEHNPNDNKISFDSNDFMEGLPPQSGDFTYVFKGLDMTIGGGQVLVSNTSSTSNLRIDSLGLLKFRGDDSVSFQFSATVLTEIIGTLVFKKVGDDYSVYINGTQFGNTITNTADFNVIRLGISSGISINGSLQALLIYDRALTEEEIEAIS